jgi:hypothetical protein
MTDSEYTKKRVIVLDCETNGLGNGREWACLYFMQKHIQDMTDRAEKSFDYLSETKNVLKRVLEDMLDSSKYEEHDKNSIKIAFHKISITKGSFDDVFSHFWSKQLVDAKPTRPWTEAYKDAFTKRALQTLSQTMKWKFIREPNKGREKGPLHFYYDSANESTYRGPNTGTVEEFNGENKDHIDNVVRVIFGRRILSICMLQFRIDSRDGIHTLHQEDVYCETFKQTEHYLHNKQIETIHHLSHQQLQSSIHDISSLHDKLIDVAKQTCDLTFAAHNASQDRKWILESIDNQIEYLQYLIYKNGDESDVHHKRIQTLNNLNY